MKCHKEVDHRKSSPETVYELKKAALRLKRQGRSVKEIVEITGLADQTVRDAFFAYDSGGINAVKPKRRGRKPGEKRRLSPKQEQEVIKLLVDHTPEQLQFECCLCTRAAVRALILREYGVYLPVRTMGEYLKRWGFTVQPPAKQAMKRNPEAVEKWLREEYPAIHVRAKREGAEIFWGDETAVQNVAHYARGYALRGHTPVLRIATQKMHLHLISAISRNGTQHFLLYSEANNADRLIGFMEGLIGDASRKVFLLLDNLRVHHSKKVGEWAQERSEQIALFYLPAYAPEYNPDEYLNHDLKRTLGTQSMVKDKQELQSHTEAFMNSLSTDPDHVEAYFNHPVLQPYKID